MAEKIYTQEDFDLRVAKETKKYSNHVAPKEHLKVLKENETFQSQIKHHEAKPGLLKEFTKAGGNTDAFEDFLSLNGKEIGETEDIAKTMKSLAENKPHFFEQEKEFNLQNELNQGGEPDKKAATEREELRTLGNGGVPAAARRLEEKTT